jgi:nitroreductase
MPTPVTNPTLDLIANRRSVRSFAERPVDRATVDAIVGAAMRSPTAGNLMLYSIIEVTEQAIKDRLAVTCDNQPFIARAPLVLLFLADYQRLFDLYVASEAEELATRRGETLRRPEVGDLFIAVCDALIAAQTSVIAAESLGLGSCYIGDILENYEIHRELFDLPEHVFPITLVCYGHPREDHRSGPPTPRFAQEYVHFANRYRRFDRESLLRMTDPIKARYFRDVAFDGEIRNIGQHFYARKHASAFAREMSRSVAAALRVWTEPAA